MAAAGGAASLLELSQADPGPSAGTQHKDEREERASWCPSGLLFIVILYICTRPSGHQLQLKVKVGLQSARKAEGAQHWLLARPAPNRSACCTAPCCNSRKGQTRATRAAMVGDLRLRQLKSRQLKSLTCLIQSVPDLPPRIGPNCTFSIKKPKTKITQGTSAT